MFLISFIINLKLKYLLCISNKLLIVTIEHTFCFNTFYYYYKEFHVLITIIIIKSDYILLYIADLKL